MTRKKANERRKLSIELSFLGVVASRPWVVACNPRNIDEQSGKSWRSTAEAPRGTLRARIGRELHDDINQRLALLAIELGQLQAHPADVASRVQQIRQKTDEISRDVQSLSHDLHPSKLEYLGAVAGMRSWCNEFAERQGIEIDFKTDVSSRIPAEVGVCLFRVLQEAFHNAAKYSGVKHIEVRLAERSHAVHLMISDSGRGFDLEPAMLGQGLGFTSMRERARLVDGTISIESKPMGGTTIFCIPLNSAQTSQRAAG